MPRARHRAARERHGESRGELPSERTLYEDAEIAWQRLTELQPDPAKRFIYGHSLGGAVAVGSASSVDAGACVAAKVPS